MKTPISTMITIGYAISGEIRKPLETKNVANRTKMTPPSRNLAPRPGPGQDTHERQNLARENQIG